MTPTEEQPRSAPEEGNDVRVQLETAMSAQHGCDTLLSTSGRPCNRCRQSAKTLLPTVAEVRAAAWDEGYAAAEADEDRHPWEATRNPYRASALRAEGEA